MKHLKIKPILLSLKKYLPIILIIALAVFLRLYLFEKRFSFDADQEELAFKAKEVLSGNPVLLGPKTSLGGFSIGPGFIYLWAIFSFFLKGNPASGSYLSVFLGILFIIGIYLMGRKIFSEKVGIVLSFILALSFILISWDQGPWAPSLFHLGELIIFYGTYISRNKKYGFPLMALGLGICFQSHFAVFLLIFPLIIYLLIYRPIIDKKNLIISIVILTLSILPLVIFDLSHGFINFQRLLSIFSLGREGIAPSKMKIITTLVQNCTNILWLHLPIFLSYVIFVGSMLYCFWKILKDKVYRSLLILSSLFLFIPAIIFLFYKSNFTEYYLMTVVIPFLFLLGYIFKSIKSTLVLLIIFAIFSFLNIKSFIYANKPMNLDAKEKIVQEIIKMGGERGYGVSVSVKPGYGFGYSYLFDYYKAKPDIPPLKNQTKIFTIVSPPGYMGIMPIIEADGVGLRWEGI